MLRLERVSVVVCLLSCLVLESWGGGGGSCETKRTGTYVHVSWDEKLLGRFL